ncbi:hypothetical protein QZL74_11975 [Burkholderia gladioli pv. alliicola]|uniref:hypothetical protein n=1 Tax=Burkholderia gladioli TaxID=28095 RepID=UPI001640107D|nr:hypothetical protein [Burkholderia gladioli]
MIAEEIEHAEPEWLDKTTDITSVARKKGETGGDRAPSLPIDAGAAAPTMRDTRSCIDTCRVAIHEKCNISID